ncbi:uncharacterized protein LOC118515131 [Anopheles stephensi]|nr:uncharacterized protein LOC118515131 [Anopheles stephensi]
MSTPPVKRSRKVMNRANKMLAVLHSEVRQQNRDEEVPGPSRIVPRLIDSTIQGENQPQEMEDSSQLANLTDAAFGENSFNIFGGGSEGDLVVEELDDSSTVEQGGGIIDLEDIFRKWTALPLPKDSRTLLKTSTTIGQEIRTVPGGEFWYKGIENKLNSYFQ